MPILPSVQKDSINVSGGESNMAAVPESGIGQFAGFVNDVSKDYFINEKHQFDKVRIIEAQNVMEAHKSRLQIDEKEGYQNKLGEQAFLFKDDEGRDFVNSYAERYNQAAEDTITQLQLTPDQQQMFREMTAKDSQRWVDGIRQHQVKEGFRYKESVLTNTVELASRKAMGSYQDIDSMEENLTTINAAVTEMGKQFGWSQAEVTNKIAESYAAVHNENLKSILDGGDFDLADAYLDNYSSHIPELNRHSFQNKITAMKQDFATQQIINNIQLATLEGSNPAYSTADPGLLEDMVAGLDEEYGLDQSIDDEIESVTGKRPTGKSNIPNSQKRNIRYNDPRLDALTELTGRELDMAWAKPIVTALRLAGEKSNNNQVSPAGAKGIMQFMPVAVEQVRRHTGKKIDPLDPKQSVWGAYQFVDWISKHLKTRDPALIASYYNGGGQFINQIKKGGVNAISDEENRNYVNRINTFLQRDYANHINRPMIGAELNPAIIAKLPPSEQQKVITAHKAALKAREDAKKQESENFYNAAVDAIEAGQLTSLGQLDQDGLRLLDATQQKNLKSIFKAEQLGEYDNDTYLEVLTNTAALKGMPQKEFKGLLMSIPPNARESLAKDYARVNGRSVQDAINVEKANSKAAAAKAPKESIVTPSNITKVLTRNAAAIGFSNGKVGTSKKANASGQRGSAFWVATINDITTRVREAELRTGKNFNEAQIDRVVNAYIDNAVLKVGGQTKGQLYDPKTFKRDDVIQPVNDYILRNVRGLGYTDIKDVPDSTFLKYYFRFYRGK